MDLTIVEELTGAAGAVAGIAIEHSACLACHCYRELAEETVVLLSVVAAHPEPVLTPGGAADLSVASRLAEILDSSEGTHG